MADAVAQTYSRLDYLHPFREGNSRTLCTFTEQLARDNNHQLDWGTTNVTAQSRNALYIARDVAVIQLRYPGLKADKMISVERREEYEMAFKLNQYRHHDTLQEIVRRSLEHGRDQVSSDRTMSVIEAARQISVVAPIAANQVERGTGETRMAVLRQKASASQYAEAVTMWDWVRREGNMVVLSQRLSQIQSGEVTINYDPGAPAPRRSGD